MKTFKIKTEYITLGQFLKAEGFIGSGGEAKFFLWDNDVFVNDEKRTERGKKLRDQDVVKIKSNLYQIINDQKY